MIFDGNFVYKNEGNRIIGLRDEDLLKLGNSYKSEEVIVNPNVEPTQEVVNAPVEPVVSPVSEIPVMNEESVAPVVQEASVVSEPKVETPEVSAEELPKVTIPEMENNIFDNPIASVIDSQVAKENITLETPQELYKAEEPVVSSEVATPAFEMPAEVSQPSNDFEPLKEVQDIVSEVAEVTEAPVVETPVEPKVTSEVPVAEEEPEKESTIIYLDNIRKALEDKNTLINALKEKNEVLTSENARLNEEVIALKNKVAVANQRAMIAEGGRQEAFANAAPQVEATRVLSPESNVNLAA